MSEGSVEGAGAGQEEEDQKEKVISAPPTPIKEKGKCKGRGSGAGEGSVGRGSRVGPTSPATRPAGVCLGAELASYDEVKVGSTSLIQYSVLKNP